MLYLLGGLITFTSIQFKYTNISESHLKIDFAANGNIGNRILLYLTW